MLSVLLNNVMIGILSSANNEIVRITNFCSCLLFICRLLKSQSSRKFPEALDYINQFI